MVECSWIQISATWEGGLFYCDKLPWNNLSHLSRCTSVLPVMFVTTKNNMLILLQNHCQPAAIALCSLLDTLCLKVENLTCLANLPQFYDNIIWPRKVTDSRMSITIPFLLENTVYTVEWHQHWTGMWLFSCWVIRILGSPISCITCRKNVEQLLPWI